MSASAKKDVEKRAKDLQKQVEVGTLVMYCRIDIRIILLEHSFGSRIGLLG
jgi:hypothetical protein